MSVRRWTWIVAAALLVLAGLGPEPAAARTCLEEECGTPACYAQTLDVRPGRTRRFGLSCSRAVGARVTRQGAHTTATDVQVTYYGTQLTLATDAAADGPDEIVLTVTGYQREREVTVPLRAIPLSVNSPPSCHVDPITRRSVGTGPQDVDVRAYCWDPEADEFTVAGTGPGKHLGLPQEVEPGGSGAGWIYRTTSANTTEVARIWATDFLGARGADAEVRVTVGPNVDQPPTCHGNPWWFTDGAMPVHTRPGATRRFTVICEDLDGDETIPRLEQPPSHGAFATFLPIPLWSARAYVWLDVTYVPEPGTGLQPDPFAVRATGPRGDGPTARLEMVPREPPENGGGGCGWSPARIVTGAPGALTLSCTDDDGDPLSVAVTEAPAHGTVTEPIVLPGPGGNTEITVPYVPDPGYKGPDCVKVVVSDGHGLEMTLLLELEVGDPLPELPALPPYEPLPPLPTPVPTVPIDWDAVVRAYARDVLGTTAVAQKRILPDVTVWTPKRISRDRLRADGRAPGMLVLCSAGCSLRTRSTTRGLSRRSVLIADPARPQLVWATATRAQVRRARRVRLRVGIRRPGARRVVKRAIRPRLIRPARRRCAVPARWSSGAGAPRAGATGATARS